MCTGRWPDAAAWVCGCSPRAWNTPAPGDWGVQCATCGDWIPWEWFEENHAEGNRIITAQREHDAAGFGSFLVGVVLSVREWREGETEGRIPSRRQPSPEEWRQAECLVDEVFGAGFGTGVFGPRNPGRQ